MTVQLIAEFCQNHNGEYGVLERMVYAAAENGAQVGKIQTIFAHQVAFRPQFEEGHVRDGRTLAIKRPYASEYERLKGLEIDARGQERFVELCHKAGLVPMTTCFSRDSVNFIYERGFREVKVASYDCASFPLLRELKAKFDRILVSTGATFDDEIEHAAAVLAGADFAMLHCVTMYPTPLSESHLARMAYLRRLAPVVGYSDHSRADVDGVIASKVAIHLGAQVIERHFTILGVADTRDGPVSITPAQLRDLHEFSRLSTDDQRAHLDEFHEDWRQCIGAERRDLTDGELLNRDYYRGRFASRRTGAEPGSRMIFNWEETPIA